MDVFDPSNHSFSYTIIGDNEPESTFDTFYSQNDNKNVKFHMVPEMLVKNINQTLYQVSEDRDSWDYIYNIENFIHLDGPEYRRLRYQIRTFDKENGNNSSLISYNVEDEKDNPVLLSTFKSWKNVYQFGNDPEEIETHAMQERILNYQHIPFNCLQYFYKNKLSGFVIYSYPPQNEYAIIHHLKCSYELEYMFDYIFFEALKLFHKDGKKYLNLEQDLGKPGLRKHKELLRPERYLKKYIVKKS
ncbi:MAG: phosphatidylglycerol lysyltransferase domain-containing protein [Candidatus Saccharibacteria bacterium]